MRAYGLDVAPLPSRLGTDGPASVREQDLVGNGAFAGRPMGHLAYQELHVIRGGKVSRLDHADEAREHRGHLLHDRVGANDAHLAATHRDHGIEGRLDAAQEGVGGTHQCGGIHRVRNGQSDVSWLHVPPNGATGVHAVAAASMIDVCRPAVMRRRPRACRPP